MVSDWISRINSLVKYSFYLLFFITPLTMWPDTYELFEFNKMWVVFGIAVFIFFLWTAKSILRGKIEIRRTPLDIPIALFLISQIISTIISIDPHVSLWGYYSRFNGGLLSIFAYIFLYYAFASNLTKNANERVREFRENIRDFCEKGDSETSISYKILLISLASGLVVTLWGLPSHFGYDLTCLVFRGELNTACWTEAFQPTVRIFSTLGQPNWLGTYLAALIPISLGFGFYKLNESRNKLFPIIYLLVSSIYFLALLWTRSQSSFVGLGIGLLVFFGILIVKNARELKQKFAKNNLAKYFALSILIFAFITFFIGTPIESLNKFTTLSGFSRIISKPPFDFAQGKPAKSQELKAKGEGLASTTNIQLGGTESSKIRLIVWQGAIELFKRNPLFGTGVETYAYAYYNVKPMMHNLTSEWDYLYNKAHNEYLNYLATTGTFGLLSYLSIIFLFLFHSFRQILKSKNAYNPILTGILGGFTALIISNFFGFSVVILNLFLFMFPILFFELSQNRYLSRLIIIPLGKEAVGKAAPGKIALILIVALVALYFEFYLLNFWSADRKYALGYNLNKAGEYVRAFTLLSDASKMLPSEDLYKDELSINMATLAILLADQNQSTQAAQFTIEAKQLSDEITKKHPKNVIFLKTRARVFYALAQTDQNYLDLAIETVNKTRELAPTDAKLVYNLALFYNQKGDAQKAITYFEEALKLKPNYLDAYYALGLFYSSLAKDDPSNSVLYKQKARESAEYILRNIDPTHEASKELLKSL